MFPPPPFPLCINLREPTASASRGATLGARIDKYRSLIMPLRFVRQLRTQTAQSLVLSVKLGAPFSRRLAARTLNWHIPRIRTHWISVRSSLGVPPERAKHVREGESSIKLLVCFTKQFPKTSLQKATNLTNKIKNVRKICGKCWFFAVNRLYKIFYFYANIEGFCIKSI